MIMYKSYMKPIFSSHRITGVSYTLVFLYSIVAVAGFVFNLAVIIALLKHKALINITNIYILCLALSDIVLCSFNVPMQTYYEIYELADLCTNQCRLLFTSFGIPMYVSSLIILLIAIDRHQMIVYPLNKRITTCKAVLSVVAVLVFSIISSIPVAMYTVSNFIDNFKMFINLTNIPTIPKYCLEIWPVKNLRIGYSILTFLVLFLCPLTITSGLYVHIYNSLNTKRIFKKKETNRKKRTNKLLSLVVLTFGICWSPWCIYSLLLEVYSFFNPIPKSETNLLIQIFCQRVLDFKSLILLSVNPSTGPANHSQQLDFNIYHNPTKFIDGRATKVVDMILKLFAMGSAIVNPFLYGWLNETIRLSMIKLIHPCISRICWGNSDNDELRFNDQRAFGLTIIHRPTRRKFQNHGENFLLPGHCKLSLESTPSYKPAYPLSDEVDTIMCTSYS